MSAVGAKDVRPGRQRRDRDAGFTLIEVLVATAIFAIIAVVAWSGTSALVGARERLAREGERLRALQIAVSGLERDLRQVVERPVRGPGGAVLPALVGDALGLELTHHGFATALDPNGGRVRRTAWRYADRELVRLRHPTLDRADFGPRAAPEAVLGEVAAFRLRYLDGRGAWVQAWPPGQGPEARVDALPRAVEFTLEVDGLGTIRRVVTPPEVGPR
jgi:general secretion pathway protein J